MPPRARKRSSSAQSWRRDCGSRPVVGSSRNSRSGSPTSAHATARRCFCPPDSLPTQLPALRLELDHREHLVDRRAAVVERPEQRDDLFDGELVAELRLLELDTEPLPQRVVVGAPAHAEDLDVAGVRLDQAFEDLDGGRLAGAVRPEQAEALPCPHLEIEAGHGDDVAVSLVQAAAHERRRRR